MSTDRPRPRPVVTDVDTGGFFAAAARDELAVCTCAQCGAVLHLPRAYCHHCGHWGVTWRPVAGRGRLYSWTTVEHQVHPAFPVPYTVVLVDLVDEPGVRLVGYLQGRPELEAGMEMQVWFEALDDDTKIPQWTPITPGGG
ncbi:MAG TPA: OB-fold domain-containing protein [Acidimicrobiia bacterium]|nr:OB-fold domain-containing protein [Acidimicrobiia bacterium]